MGRLVPTATVCVMVCLLAGPVTAQEASPLIPPPPWFGGQRVEVPERGLALTVPDGWVAFDLAVDPSSQLTAAAGYVDPAVWPPEEADYLSETASAGATMLLGDAHGANACGIFPRQDVGMPPGAWADWVADRAAADPGYRDVERPQHLDLPAGPAYVIRLSGVALETWTQSSFFLLGEQASIVAVLCSNSARTDDLWLSIVGSIEFLPVEE